MNEPLKDKAPALSDGDLRLAVLERDVLSHSKRLKLLEEKAEKINDIAIMTERISAKMDTVKEKIEYVDTRLRGIESTPGSDLNYYKRAIVSALVSGALGAVLGAVSAVIIR